MSFSEEERKDQTLDCRKEKVKLPGWGNGINTKINPKS